MERGKISSRQAMWLVITTIMPTAVVALPTLVISEAKSDAWLSFIILTIAGMAVAALIIALGLRFPDQTIVEYSRTLVGRWLGKAIGLVYVAFFIYIDAIIVRELADMVTAGFMPEVPLRVMIVVDIAVAAYAVNAGLEVLARTNEIFLPVLLFIILAVPGLNLDKADFKNLLPVLAEGFSPVARGAFPATVWFAETIVMAMILPAVNLPRQALRGTVLAVALSGAFITAVTIWIIAVLGVGLVATDLFPFLSLGRLVSIADFLERIEWTTMFIWTLGGTIKIGVFYYCAALAAEQVLGLRDYRPTILPIGVAMGLLSFYTIPDIAFLTALLKQLMQIPFLSVQVGLPAMLMLIALIRRMGGAGGSGGEQ